MKKGVAVLTNGPGGNFHEPGGREVVAVAAVGVLSTFVHVAVMLGTDKPIPARKAAAAAFLTGCVGSSSAALAILYWHIHPWAVVASSPLVGYLGGPLLLSIMGAGARAWLERKAKAVGSGEEPGQ